MDRLRREVTKLLYIFVYFIFSFNIECVPRKKEETGLGRGVSEKFPEKFDGAGERSSKNQS